MNVDKDGNLFRTYTYDSPFDLTSITHEESTTTYEYHSMSRKIVSKTETGAAGAVINKQEFFNSDEAKLAVRNLMDVDLGTLFGSTQLINELEIGNDEQDPMLTYTYDDNLRQVRVNKPGKFAYVAIHIF